VSSHILSEVQQLADVVGIIARGRLVREGPVEALLREAGSVRVRVGESDVPVAGGLIEAFAGAGTVSLVAGPEAGWLEVRLDPARSADLNRVLAVGGVFASRIEAGSTLEALFLEVTGSAPDVAAPGRPGGTVPGWPS
jgi:ABC-2 type transport system ATP-binding protein